MYTEGFEGLEEAEKEPRRTYVSGNDTDRLLRENEKLKKSLEKEQFFNKLLDQEIQELKMNTPAYAKQQEFHSEYWSGSRGVSRGAFFLLLVITLLMAGYIGYGVYYDKPFNYLGIGKAATPVAAVLPQQTVAAREEAPAVPAATTSSTETPSATTPPVTAARDSVPNIIGGKKVTTPPVVPAAEKPKASQKAAVAVTADDEYDEDEVNKVINDDSPSRPITPVAAKRVEESRTVIAKYKVTSKANFYNNPDENSMRGTFIAGDLNKTVEALEEKNGFIFVVYTNDLGFTSRGWLSKQDLTKE